METDKKNKRSKLVYAGVIVILIVFFIVGLFRSLCGGFGAFLVLLDQLLVNEDTAAGLANNDFLVQTDV